MKTNARLAAQILAGFLVVLAAGLFLPVFGHTAKRGAQTTSLSYGRQLVTGCKFYAQDHGGRFPIHLSELEPDYIVDVKSLRGVIHDADDQPQYRYDWLYFGAGFTEGNPPAVFLASPQLVVTPDKPQQRVVINGDTTGVVINDDQYEKLLVEAVRQMRELDDRQHPAQPAKTGSATK